MSVAIDFAGKKAFITGGAGGIGAACARMFVERGGDLLVVDRNVDAARTVAKAVGGRAEMLDVTDAAAVTTLVRRMVDTDFAPDVLVNCAGIREFADPLDITPEHWQVMLSVNLSGTFYITQAIARLWRDTKRGGAIVNTASTSGIFASEKRVGYVASKHGVVGMTRQLALDLGPLGIRINAVAPGVVRTPMTEAYFKDPTVSERIRSVYPLGRVGEAEDVAEVILFLASDRARHVTGAVIPVDAGYTAGRRK